MPRRANIVTATVTLFFCAASVAAASEITVLSTPTFEPVLREVLTEYERLSGDKVHIRYGAAGALQREIDGGARFDVALLLTDSVTALSKSGKLRPDSTIDVARALLGVAVRHPAEREIKTADDLKAAILAAKALSYGPDSASGRSFLATLDRLGLSRDVVGKLVATTGNPVAAIARGDADLTVITVPNILFVPGVALAGLLPSELQNPTTFTAAVAVESAEPEAAKKFISHLKSRALVPAMSKAGLIPEG